MFKDLDYKCVEIAVIDGIFSGAQEPIYIVFMQLRCESILDLIFIITFAEQPSPFETLAKWIALITCVLSYYHRAVRCIEHLE